MNEAERLFGPPCGPVAISGFRYPQWLLDNSNLLATAFTLDTGRLERANVKTPTGEIIEHVLDYPQR